MLLVEDRELLADSGRNSELKTKLFAENIKGRVQWDFLSLALRGRKIGLEQVLKMFDDIIAELKQNQFSEESKKEHCEKELEVSDDNKKASEAGVFDPKMAHEATSGSSGTAAHRPVAGFWRGPKKRRCVYCTTSSRCCHPTCWQVCHYNLTRVNRGCSNGRSADSQDRRLGIDNCEWQCLPLH